MVDHGGTRRCTRKESRPPKRTRKSASSQGEICDWISDLKRKLEGLERKCMETQRWAEGVASCYTHMWVSGGRRSITCGLCVAVAASIGILPTLFPQVVSPYG